MDVVEQAPRTARAEIDLQLGALSEYLAVIQPGGSELAYATGVTWFNGADVAREDWPHVHAQLAALRLEYAL